MTDYKELLQRYDTYVSGEKRSAQQEKVHKQKQRLREKHLVADELLFETRFLFFNNYQREHVHYLIDKFQDFRKLHGKCSKEAIILAFIFYTAKIKNPRLKLSDYRITAKYGLTDNVFQLIICRVVQTLLRESGMVPIHTTKYDHEVLCKTGQK